MVQNEISKLAVFLVDRMHHWILLLINYSEKVSEQFNNRTWILASYIDSFDNVIKHLVHNSAVRMPRYWALGKFGEHSRGKKCFRLHLEQLLRLFRALQSSCELNISTYVRWLMN